jgi:UDP-N-acetylmuramoyl-tripeptide--D-alanyl-D-alanine ligase
MITLNALQLIEDLEAKSSKIDGSVWKRDLQLVTDSRGLGAHHCFLCLKGERFDAHDFVHQAAELGCPLVVVHQSWVDQQTEIPTSYIAVEDTTRALGQLARAHAKRQKALRIGITGSNGKTTTKEMLLQVLSSQASTVATKANFNNHIGVPQTLFSIHDQAQYAIIEMGTNHPGEIAYLSEVVEPQIAIITNIGDSHLEFFGNRDNVFPEKLSIRNHMPQGGTLVVNADDPYLSTVQAQAGQRLLTYGLENGEIRATDISWDNNLFPTFFVLGRKYNLQAPGKHNLSNAVGVIATCLHLGIAPDAIAQALAQFTSSQKRSEMIPLAGGIRIIADCYNANPTSMASALEVLGGMSCTGRRIAVLGDMFELGATAEDSHAKVGKWVAEQPISILHTIGEKSQILRRKATLAKPELEAQHWSDPEALLQHLQADLREGDLILFKASNGMKLSVLVQKLIESKEV